MLNNTKIDELKQAIPDILFCTDLKKESATSHCGPCPVCGGTDRFVYKTDTGKCWCRGCHEKAMDKIDFHCWKDGKSVSDLIKEYLPDDDTGRNEYTTPMDLFSRRGLAEKAVNIIVESMGIKVAKHAGKQCVAVPYVTLDGETRATQYLTIDQKPFPFTEKNGKPANKVFGKGDKPGGNCFFIAGPGPDQVKFLIISESIFNTITARKLFPDACCIALGGSTLTRKVSALKPYLNSVERVVVCQDNDNAGNKMVQAIYKILGNKVRSLAWEPDDKPGLDINDLLQAGQDERGKSLIDSALPMCDDHPKKPELAEILYSVNGSGVCCREISKKLGQADNKIFRLGGQAVKIVEKPPTSVRMLKKSTGGEYPAMPIISHLRPESLTHEIEKIAICKTKTPKGVKTIPWPKRVIQGVLELTEYHEKNLIGIVEHPYISNDFKPVTDPGYDPNTGLYKCFNGSIRPDIFSDANKAASFLCDEVFADFSFASELDLYAAVSCLLTGMQRKLISDNSGCPGYLITAPVQASGKTTVGQVINHSLYSRPAAASTFSEDGAEMGKHLLGILLEGHSSILFDNLQEGSVIESNELSKALTADTYSNRWLGRNQTITVPCSVLWMFTGNNISVCGDFNTRILPIELDPRTANPDQRSFTRRDVGAWCEQNREKILSACMQVIMAGKNFKSTGIKPSRFPSWDKFVRYPLYKITGEDIGEIFQKNKQADPKLEGQRNFFEAWFETFGSTPQTAKQVLDKCREPQPGYTAETDDNPLLDAMNDIFTGADLPSTRSLGKWLSGMKNRFFGDYKLIHAGTGTTRTQSNKTLWKVQNCNK